MKRKKIVILGSTGSIGESALDVIARHPDRFEVLGLVAGSNIEKLNEQAAKFHPKFTALGKETEKICELATHPEADVILSAIVGAAGLRPTYEALRAGKTVALANKESLVAAGALMTQAAVGSKAQLLPVDSEHSAIHQVLRGYPHHEISQIILTASGGPFRGWKKEALAQVSVEQALKHPNWSMGNKITIDSATMMNKGLEMIEARWLFNVPSEKIQIKIHPQSIIHSLVEYCDGSMLAQMGVPDMRVPIAYALAYPDRVTTGVAPLNLLEASPLTFEEPDVENFRSLALARHALETGKTCPAVLNAANEIAVEAFLKRKIGFLKIAELVEAALEAHQPTEPKNLEDVLAADRWARELTESTITREV